MRSAGCFLFSLLSMFMVLNVSAASPFGCVDILTLYLSALLLIASMTVGISRSLRMSSFLTYQGPFTIVLRILACITSILFIWLIAAVPHNGIPYALIGFMIVLYIFNLSIWTFGRIFERYYFHVGDHQRGTILASDRL